MSVGKPLRVSTTASMRQRVPLSDLGDLDNFEDDNL
jgi:hypothetical protein